MKNAINEVNKLKKLAGIVAENADESKIPAPEKIKLPKGAKVRDWTSDGEHYVELHKYWTLRTKDRALLTAGKLDDRGDAEKYLKRLASK